MSRLWDRGTSLDDRIESFTVGRDPELDLRLVAYDALASAAHGEMLRSIGVLSPGEYRDLRRELGIIAREARAGAFEIPRSDEDGHTAIENRLTERLGDAGRRIHTGRSRNDQVIAALRLWGREMVLAQIQELLEVGERLLDLAEEHSQVSCPGYTHTRQAMPSTLGFLFAAHGANLLDDLPWLRTAFNHIDRSPLGSASGYGVALPLDRQRVADALGFRRLQGNTLAVQNDRGKTEHLVLGAALSALLDLGRLANDLILFSCDELRFIALHESVTTGSSIMPQKRNPDVLELIRGTAARIRSRHAEIGAVYSPLGAGYHRDLQLTKEPFLQGMQAVVDGLWAIQPVLNTLEVDPDRCRDALLRSIGATDAVYLRVAQGEPFRSAYKDVAADPACAVSGDPADLWRQRVHEGAPGALRVDAERRTLSEARSWLEREKDRLAGVWALLESD